MNPEAAVASFFAAMNEHDADTAASLVAPTVEIVFAPSQVFVGRKAVRELAAQEHPELVFETVPVGFDSDGDLLDVSARRVQRWRDSGEVAHEEMLQARFDFDAAGLIARVDLS